ncbi:MAG: six-cysteine ranthipeptide SCIFF [Oscillospiraceae bacterium]|nr:six-cysteine ranthipeptide SCIFF [Oscillospiraceae bacterium]
METTRVEKTRENAHIRTLNPKLSKTKNKKTTGCGECQASCQSACKTSCTVANQSCENNQK